MMPIPLRISLYALSSAASLSCVVPLAHSQNNYAKPNCEMVCNGEREIHNTDAYRFNTYTRLFQRDGFYIYQTCVENRSEKDLEINWYIPGPDSWIPKSCSIISDRERMTNDTLGGFRSCLRYGHSWKHLRAKFLAHASDKAQMDSDLSRGQDCSSAPIKVDQPTAPLKPQPLFKRVEFFAPGDEKNVANTLTKITFDIKIEVDFPKNTISQHIAYFASAAYLDNKDFKYTNFKVVPDPFMREFFMTRADDKRINKNGTFNVTQKDVVSISYSIPGNPVLVSLAYAVFNQNETRIGSILLPTWRTGQ